MINFNIGHRHMLMKQGMLDDERVKALLDVHVRRARAETAPGSAHALDLDALKTPDIHFWTLWDGDALLGVGAWKRLSEDHGEIKSMHVAEGSRRRGAGSALLRHIMADAQTAGMRRLSLETGSWDYFRPAAALYARHGFVACGPFGNYQPNPNNVFMTVTVEDGGAEGEN